MGMADEEAVPPAAVSDPPAAIAEVLDFAVQLSSLAKDGKRYRIRRNTSDLMFTMGHYCSQSPRADAQQRLIVIADTLRYLSGKLST
jgi:hypothetical protein